MPVRLTILGSGSAGNCAYVETDETRLLIDAGLSGRQIRKRLASIGRTPESLTGILITHEHSDHIQGLTALAVKLKIPIYTNRPTQEAIQYQVKTGFVYRLFATGTQFEVGDITVETFSVPHDAYDPVGFLIRTNSANIGVLTDLGHATRLVMERVRAANVLLIEANHDVKLLQDCPHRPWSLKQRILSRHGHLSNEAAADTVQQVTSADLRHLFLGHISRDCNRADLAQRVVQDRLNKMGAQHVQLHVATQDVPCATLSI